MYMMDRIDQHVSWYGSSFSNIQPLFFSLFSSEVLIIGLLSIVGAVLLQKAADSIFNTLFFTMLYFPHLINAVHYREHYFQYTVCCLQCERMQSVTF